MAIPGLRLRPLTLPDILDESFRLYRAHFPLLAGLAFALAIPGLIVSLLAGTQNQFGGFLGLLLHPGSTVDPGVFQQQNPLLLLLQYPVQLAMVPFQTGAVFLAAICIVLGRPVSFRVVLSGIVRRYLALWLINLLYLAVALTLFCFPVTIWLGARLSLAVPVLLTEESGAGVAIERSWRLTDGSFWRTLAVIVLSLVLGTVLQWALLPVFAGAATLIPLSLAFKGALVLVALSITPQIAQPLFAIALTLVYFDLRVRREAFDLEMMAYQITAAPLAGTT